MALSEYRSKTNSYGKIVVVTELENELKKDKARAKSNFTRSRNELLCVVV